MDLVIIILNEARQRKTNIGYYSYAEPKKKNNTNEPFNKKEIYSQT